MEIEIGDLKIVEPRQPILAVEVDTSTTEAGNYHEIIESILIQYARKNPKKIISIYNETHNSANFQRPTVSDCFICAQSEELAQYINQALLKQKMRSRMGNILPNLSNLSYHIENGKAWRRSDMITFDLLGEDD